jgi:arylsulfatase A-like enzyme
MQSGNSGLPNILIVMVDQQRYDCIGASKMYPVRTPHLDKLAGEGAWFTNAYTPIPLCCPARQAFISGRRPETFGALWNFGISLPVQALQPDEFAWPRELQRLGYRTGYIGKWNVHPKHPATRYGYDEYIPEDAYVEFKQSHYPDVVYTQGFLGEKDPIPLEHSRTHWLADEAIRLLEAYAEESEPWHIRLDFPEPHLPCRPAGKFAEMYKPEDIPEWGSFGETFANKPYIQRQQLYNWRIEDYTWDDWAPIAARYYGAISQTDDAIGKVLSKLSELGLDNNTIVIYTTDHGDMCGGHRMMDKHYVLYEDIVKVPLIVKWPGHIAPGTVCSQFVTNLLDLPPTILQIVGAMTEPLEKRLHGRTLLPLLKGDQPGDWRQGVVSTYNGQQFGLYTQRMLREEGWKYIWNTTDVDELYDLRRDPNELINLIHSQEHEERVRGMRNRLYEQLKEWGDGLVNNAWMKDQLLNGRKAPV